jgi:cold shock CspA family protein
MRGVIKTLNKEKFYGFIKPESGPEFFFHSSDLAEDNWDEILGSYATGTVQVDFNPNKTPKGMRARDVRLVNHD